MYIDYIEPVDLKRKLIKSEQRIYWVQAPMGYGKSRFLEQMQASNSASLVVKYKFSLADRSISRFLVDIIEQFQNTLSNNKPKQRNSFHPQDDLSTGFDYMDVARPAQISAFHDLTRRFQSYEDTFRGEDPDDVKASDLTKGNEKKTEKGDFSEISQLDTQMDTKSKVSFKSLCCRWLDELFHQLKASPPDESNNTDSIVLLFDDFYLVDHHPLFSIFIESLIESVSKQTHVFITSRKSPSENMAHLILSGHLTVLGHESLSLSKEALAEYLNENNIQRVGASELFSITNGWPVAVAGLLSSSGKRDGHVTRSFKTIAPILIQYVQAELSRTFPINAHLLLQLAQFPIFNDEMVSLVCGTSIDKSRVFILGLIENGFFVQNDTKLTHFYRFDNVIYRAAKVYFHNRPLLWSENSTNPSLLWEKLRQGIYANGHSLLAMGYDNEFMELITFLPKAQGDNIQLQVYWEARSLMVRSPKQARMKLERLYLEQNKHDIHAQLLFWSAIADSYVIELREFNSARIWVERFVELEKRIEKYPSQQLEALVLIGLNGYFQWIAPDDYNTENLLDRSEQLLLELEDEYLRLRLASACIRHLVIQGQYYRGQAILNLINHDRVKESFSLYDAVILHYSRIIGSYISGVHLIDEHLALRQSQNTLRQMGIQVMDLSIRYLKVLGRLGVGDIKTARLDLLEAKQSLNSSFALNEAHYYFAQGWLALEEYDYGLAHESLEYAYTRSRESSEICTIYCLSQLVILNIEKQDWQKTKGYIGELQELDVIRNVGFARMHYLFCNAYYSFYQENIHEAVTATNDLFRFLRENGIYDFSAKVGRVFVSLVEFALEKDIEIAFVNKLIEFLNLKPQLLGNLNESWPQPLKVKVLETDQFVLNKVVLKGKALPSKTESRLLKFLISQQGSKVEILKLEEILWPEIESFIPGSKFKSTTARLRKRFDIKDIVRVRDNKVALNSRLVWVDSWSLKNALDSLINRVDKLPSIELNRFMTLLVSLNRFTGVGLIEQEIWYVHYHVTLQIYYFRFMLRAFERCDFIFDKVDPQWLIAIKQKIRYQLAEIEKQPLVDSAFVGEFKDWNLLKNKLLKNIDQ